MTVYVLRRYWDTPDNEGNDIMGVYYNFKDAQDDMHTDVRPIHEHYPEDFWSPDMTWAEDNEIHLGFDPMNGKPATVYCWEIVEMEVQ